MPLTFGLGCVTAELTGLDAGVLEVVHVPGLPDRVRFCPPGFSAQGASQGDGVVLGRTAPEGTLPAIKVPFCRVGIYKKEFTGAKAWNMISVGAFFRWLKKG